VAAVAAARPVAVLSAPSVAVLAPAVPAEAEEAVVAAVETDEIAPWPGDTDEATFLSEARTRGDDPVLPAVVRPAEEMVPTGELPPLDQLVARVPAPVRAALEDLFRAKFVRVRRVSPTSLKS
jgi:hypothetical protein